MSPSTVGTAILVLMVLIFELRDHKRQLRGRRDVSRTAVSRKA